MYCHNCGYHNFGDACFCNNCGEKMFIRNNSMDDKYSNQKDDYEQGLKPVKNTDKYKLIIAVVIAVLVPLFLLPMFLLPASVLPIAYFFSTSKEVPKQHIEAFVEDIYGNEDFKIKKSIMTIILICI